MVGHRVGHRVDHGLPHVLSIPVGVSVPPPPPTSLQKVYPDNLHVKTDYSYRTKFLNKIFTTKLVSSTLRTAVVKFLYSPTLFV